MSSLGELYNFHGLDIPAAPRRTIKAGISCVGKGLHSGSDVLLKLLPAPSGTGIVFRNSVTGAEIAARYDNVVDTRLCTVIAENGARVGTIEHLMAAISACRIDDMFIEINAGELPILDGSAEPFLFLIESAGVVEHEGVAETIEILRPVRVAQDGAFAELLPHEPGGRGFALSLGIDFAASAIGTQRLDMTLDAPSFASEIAAARTFTLAGEVAALREAGLAKGGTLDNAIVVDGAKVLNPAGLRWADEFVRHKMLDVVGDLALAGAAISGRFVGHCTGHRINNLLLRALFADPANYRVTSGLGVLELAS